MPEKKKFLLRINPSLWDELNRWAAKEFRSVNGQIEFLLRRAVDEHLKGPAAPSGPADPGGRADPENAP